MNFRERRKGEVQRTLLLRGSVHEPCERERVAQGEAIRFVRFVKNT
jgi:hypothetical protein